MKRSLSSSLTRRRRATSTTLSIQNQQQRCCYSTSRNCCHNVLFLPKSINNSNNGNRIVRYYQQRQYQQSAVLCYDDTNKSTNRMCRMINCDKNTQNGHNNCSVPSLIHTIHQRTHTTFSSSSSPSSSSNSDNNEVNNNVPIDVAVTSTSYDKSIYTTNTTIPTTTAVIPESGEDAYRIYESIQEKILQYNDTKERMKSERMYDEWKKYSERKEPQNNTSMKRDGVAVIKTIVRQVRNDNKAKVHNNDDNNDGDELSLLLQNAQKLLEISALQYNYPKALVVLGNLQLEQAQQQTQQQIDIATTTLNQAMEYYRRAGQGGCSEGWYNLGHILWTGIQDQTMMIQDGNVSHDYNSNNILLQSNQYLAMDAFLQACNLQDPDALYFVGVQYMGNDDQSNSNNKQSMESIDDNKRQQKRDGLQFIEQSASLGHRGAMHYLALFYLNGDIDLSIEPCTNDAFQRRLNDAAASEDIATTSTTASNDNSNLSSSPSPDALFVRGNCYYHGEHGYEMNHRNALNDFLYAATKLGHAESAVSAGAMFYNGGIGIPQDKRRAFELYQIGGELGSLDGWRNVVACYAIGDGVPQSTPMAKYIAKTMLGHDDDTNEQQQEKEDNDK